MVKSKSLIESTMLVLVTAFYLATQWLKLTILPYTTFSLLIACYFFPFSILYDVLKKSKPKILTIVSNLLISWLLSISSIVLYIDSSKIIDISVLILIVSNLFFIFYYISKNDPRKILHFISAFISVMAAFPY